MQMSNKKKEFAGIFIFNNVQQVHESHNHLGYKPVAILEHKLLVH